MTELYTPDDAKAAKAAYDKKYAEWGGPDEMLIAALDRIAPAIAAKALRDAAKALHDPTCPGCGDSEPHVRTATWLNDRADEIERTK